MFGMLLSSIAKYHDIVKIDEGEFSVDFGEDDIHGASERYWLIAKSKGYFYQRT